MKKSLYVALIAVLIITACKTRMAENNKKISFPVFDTEAHRGGRGLMPENTIPAMLNAIDLGISTLEMDTHISADGLVVLSHDEFVNPLFSLSPDGKEIPPADAPKFALYKMKYADIEKFDVGSKYYSTFPQQKKMKVSMPLLSDLIDHVQAYIKSSGKPQVFYNIETKCTEKDDNIYNPVPETFVKLLMDVIEKKKISQWVVIQSFDKRTLQVLNKKYPHIRTSYLIQNKMTVAENLTDLGFTPFIYSPNSKLLNAQLVKECHEKGIKVVPWTVNTKEEIAQIKAMGADGIISDYPGLLTP
ncbi:MAG TPA: glycerophosphodiester phosphodiesterase [Sphingobacteriaceae bacterium]|nr:glycerophosphodiester phosphodiesterase [Sphingobacteriaceae bacterium]